MAEIKLQVFRRLDDRDKSLALLEPQTKALRLELHKLRQTALHSIFHDEFKGFVRNWGETDLLEDRELVELLVEAVNHLTVPFVLGWMAKELASKGFDSATSTFVAWLVGRLGKKQEEGQILNSDLILPDGTTVSVDIRRPNNAIHLKFSDGTSFTVSKDRLEEESKADG